MDQHPKKPVVVFGKAASAPQAPTTSSSASVVTPKTIPIVLFGSPGLRNVEPATTPQIGISLKKHESSRNESDADRDMKRLTVSIGAKERVYVGAINIDRMPKQGHAKFTPQPMNEAHLERFDHLLEKGHPQAEAELSHLRRFRLWQSLNPSVTSIGIGVAMCASQATEDPDPLKKLNPGSAKNMIEMLMDTLTRNGVTIDDRAYANFVKDALQKEYAALGTEHALDITDEEAVSFLPRILCVDVRAAMWLIVTTGARCCDLSPERLQDWQFCFDIVAQRIMVTFMVTKTINDVTDRRTVSFPFVIPPDNAVQRYLIEKQKIPSTDRCLHVLKAAKLKEPIEGKGVTTYSFRRLFEHRIIKWYTREDGTVEWLKVIQWSGHRNERVLKGSYSQPQVLHIPKNAPGYNEEPMQLARPAKRLLARDSSTSEGSKLFMGKWLKR